MLLKGRKISSQIWPPSFNQCILEKIIRERKEANDFYKENSAVYKAFLHMEQKTYSEGDLPKKDKELIAVGISVVINCESCMEWHIKEALRGGATEQQVMEAVEVGVEMGGGPATVAARFAMKVMAYYRQKTPGF